MDSGTNNKPIKVAVICHFNNKRIADLLNVKLNYEFAPWIYEFIRIFENQGQVTFHIISPHSQIWKYQKIILSKSVTLHFFPNYRLKYFNKFLYYFNIKTDFYLHRKTITKICQKYKPDLIHVFGAENPYYSSSALDLQKKYPVLLTIQGIVNHVQENNKFNEYRKELEIRIIKELLHFGVRDIDMINFIKKHNNRATLHEHPIAPKRVNIKSNKYKKYDLIFFARIVKTKGIEDYIKLISKLKLNNPSVKSAIIGTCDRDYESFLKNMIIKYDLSKNIEWIGALSTINEVHKYVKKSRIVVLPTYSDTIPGTILESFQLEVPIIAYDVGGIPKLNDKRKSLVIIEKGNEIELYKAANELINDSNLRNNLSINGKITFEENWGDEIIRESIIAIYFSILDQKN